MMLTTVNGKLTTGHNGQVAVDDSGFLYGDSLFETLRADGQTLWWVDDHLQRLSQSCRQCAIPFDRPMAEHGLEEIRQRIDWPTTRIRLTVSRGGPDDIPLQVITARPYQAPTHQNYLHGVSCVYAANRRVNVVSHLPQMKRGNYADCLYAARQARAAGAFEALFRAADGYLLEGAISNLFVLLDGILLTPPAGELVLAGIARRRVMKAAEEMGMPVLVHSLPEELLNNASEVMLSNSLFGLLPVRQIAGQALRTGPLAAELRQHPSLAFS